MPYYDEVYDGGGAPRAHAAALAAALESLGHQGLVEAGHRRDTIFMRHGPRKVDRKKPYSARLRPRTKAGKKGRVYARVFYKRSGSKQVRRKTVSRRYVMCG